MIRSTHSLPEVRSLTPWRRDVVTNAAGNTPLHHLYFAGTVALVFFLPPATLFFGTFRWLLPSLIVGLIVALLYFPIGARMLRPTLQRILVNRRGRPFVCFGCGYRLLGLGEGRCPECGQVADLPAGGRLRRRVARVLPLPISLNRQRAVAAEAVTPVTATPFPPPAPPLPPPPVPSNP